MTEKFTSGIRVAGRAVKYWGSQSISSDMSAIFELVKNARDADATTVTIRFDNAENDKCMITVKDDGNGMTRSEVEEKWLIAGTDSKILNDRSTGGRRVWGEMGIGRFSCEKLANVTKMISRPKDSEKKITMEFDWKQYEKTGVTFDSVKHDGYVEDKKEDEHGLTLILSDVKSKWGRSKVEKLGKELGKYILPKELKSENFEIMIIAPEYGLNYGVQSKVSKSAPLQIIADFDGENLAVKIHDTENPQIYKNELDMPEGKKCGPFTFTLSFYPQDKAGETKWKNYYKKQMDDMNIEKFLHQHSGIYLYRDDVWMKPYGAKLDWLGLEARKIRRRVNIGRSQVYGIVRISQDKNPEIRPTAHREVLQSNQAYDDLRSVLIIAIRELECYREAHRRETIKSIKKHGEMAKNNIGQIIKMLKDKTELDESGIKRIIQYARTTKTYIDSHNAKQDEDEEDKQNIRRHELNVMALGLVTSYVSHEIINPINKSFDVIKEIRKTMDSTDFTSTLDESLVKQGFDWIDTLEKNTEKIIHFISFVNEISSHITASKSLGRTTHVHVKQTWDTVIKGLENLTESVNFTYEEKPSDLQIVFNKIDLESILLNLMTNSLEAMKGLESDGRKIHCMCSYDASGLTIKFSDNGKGIQADSKERIFESFYTTNRTGDDVIYGHGLGLAIVKEIILNTYGGKIEVLSNGHFESGTTFKISIPSDGVGKVWT